MVAAAMVAVLLTVTGGVLQLGGAVVARHRAQAAADLAALAAAARLPAGSGTACASARELAAHLQVSEIDCAVTGLDVVVRVSVWFSDWGLGPVRAVARAGPVG